ncbi:MAG: hypothetical protein ACR2JX_04340 [Mycobacteriales bacterium]
MGKSGIGDSPQIRLRVPAHLRDLAEDRARHEHTTVSEIARDALERALSPQRREERVQSELHRALLAKLISDYDGVRKLARGSTNGTSCSTDHPSRSFQWRLTKRTA